VFDRLVVFSGRVATAGFLIYVADGAGYLGSVAQLLWRNFGGFTLDWLQFFTLAAYATSVAGAVLTALASLHFHRRARPSADVGLVAVALQRVP
jgi:hypothetical protein